MKTCKRIADIHDTSQSPISEAAVVDVREPILHTAEVLVSISLHMDLQAGQELVSGLFLDPRSPSTPNTKRVVRRKLIELNIKGEHELYLGHDTNSSSICLASGEEIARETWRV